jgi:hypothetical protein
MRAVDRAGIDWPRNARAVSEGLVNAALDIIPWFNQRLVRCGSGRATMIASN